MQQEEFIFPGAINNLEKVLSDSSSKNILLIRGNQSFTKSGAKEALASIYKKYNITEFTGFSVNPKLEEAQLGFDLFKKKKSQIIIAVGGGSVIDTAKIIKYLAIKENSANTSIPFIAIPTTAGTGSEATHFAVVYINGIKHSFADPALLPTVALVDANLIIGQTKYQMTVSGLDAFAQGIESFWSINSTNESMSYSKKAIKLIWENLEDAIKGNNDARIKITEGSNWAGKAINIAKTTAPHAMSYGFTKKIRLPHGHAVSLSIPFFINLHLNISSNNCNDFRGVAHVNDVMLKISTILNVKKKKLVQTILLFYKNLSVSINFKDLDITNDVYQEVIKQLNYERLNNNPVKIDSNTLLQLFENNDGSKSGF
jgi:alcohol dehydrogenase class IV